MSNSSSLLVTQGYSIVKNVISKEVCQLLAEYANLKAQIKSNKRNDLLAGVHREYGDALMETLLLQLQTKVEAEMGLDLWPTLSFYYVYRNGNDLAKHKDRSSCEIVAGLCIGADSDFKKNPQGWPLMINHEGKAAAIHLDYGDMVIFKGHEKEHWREAFTGNWFVSAIFGYVEKNGRYDFQKYDQRKMLGKPHVGMLRWSLGALKNKFRTFSKKKAVDSFL